VRKKIRYTVTTYPRTARPVMTATRARTVGLATDA
jgi:hypothetical protein